MKILFSFILIVYCIYTAKAQQFSCSTRSYSCSTTTKYRTIDGSCNNLQSPWYGMAGVTVKRLLSPLDNDPNLELRSRGADGTPLPNARSISIALNSPRDTPGFTTSLCVNFGQFVTHDHVATIGFPVTCNTANNNNPECMNIPTPPEDTANRDQPFMTFNRNPFIRTDYRCRSTTREQYSVITAWMDLSATYGSDGTTLSGLRERRGGLLRVQRVNGLRDLMPANPNGVCPGAETSTQRCFLVGESRGNENMVTASVHTLFVREHNRIANIISRLRPTFTDEQIFQEARHLSIAQYQHILFTEWLPLIIGPDAIARFSLQPNAVSNSQFYNNALVPQPYIEFTAAAFRFGHSMVRSFYLKKDNNWNLIHNATFLGMTLNPTEAYQNGGLEALMRGIISEKANAFDPFYTDDVQNKFLELSGVQGPSRRSFLSAADIQRGRDANLQPYHRYREFCGLGTATRFEDFTEIQPSYLDGLRRVYRSYQDVDLIIGGLSETPVPGGTVGPTFACIIGYQFRDLKFGDRFFYEYALNDPELTEIRKASMSRMLCDNYEVPSIHQRTPFQDFGSDNQRVSCSSIPGPDFAVLYGGRPSTAVPTTPTTTAASSTTTVRTSATTITAPATPTTTAASTTTTIRTSPTTTRAPVTTIFPWYLFGPGVTDFSSLFKTN